jgi:hypothetical protein
MWLRDPIDIELTRNSAAPIGLQFWDESSDSPFDLSGYTFTCRVGIAEGQGVLTTFPCVVTDPLAGAVDIAFDGSTLALQDGRKDIITLAYQVLATSNGVTFTALRGSIILTPGVR